MPAAHTVEFRSRGGRARAVEGEAGRPARGHFWDQRVVMRRWTKFADMDESVQDGVTSDERAELARLRPKNRVQAAEIEILR